jgi:hypothetical protein
MLSDDDLRDRVAENARPLRAQLAWTRVVEPIAAFLERASFAPDALMASRTAAKARHTVAQLERLTARVQYLEWECEQLKAHLNDIRQGRVMRLLNAFNARLAWFRGRK